MKPATFAELVHPQTMVPPSEFYPTARLTHPHWQTYGMGWFLNDYKGRVAVFQMLTLNDTLRRLIARDASAPEIEEAAADAGMHSLWADGIEKVRAGLTTVDELRRILI